LRQHRTDIVKQQIIRREHAAAVNITLSVAALVIRDGRVSVSAKITAQRMVTAIVFAKAVYDKHNAVDLPFWYEPRGYYSRAVRGMDGFNYWVHMGLLLIEIF
jgi:uncharacterized membrane protein YhdT